MSEHDKKEEKDHESQEEDTRTDEEKKLNLAFPEAAIVRVMKRNLDGEKMIRKEVKVEMNRWLEKMCAQVSKNMNRFPYVMMNLNEFFQGIKVYDSLEEFQKEKDRILAHLDAIKQDIGKLERDLGKVERDIVVISMENEEAKGE
jgi:histone H3/H4